MDNIKYMPIFKDGYYFIQTIDTNKVDFKHKYCGTTSFYYKGFICNSKLYDTIDQAIKSLKTSRQILIQDII